MSSLFKQLEQEIANKLLADPFFALVPIVPVIEGSVVNKVEQNIAKLKIFGLPKVISWGKPLENVEGPYFRHIRILVTFFETSLLRKADTNLPDAWECSEVAASLLHLWKPETFNQPMVFDDSGGEPDEDKKLLIINNPFYCQGGFARVLPQVEPPVIDDDAGEITLTCATAGAALFYTVDGKHPAPRNGTFYTAPFTPLSGSVLKVRAWLAGYQTSEIATLNIP